MQKSPEEIARSLTVSEMEVLMEVRENGGWLVICIDDISMDTHLPRRRVCKILKYLKSLELVEYGRLTDGDDTRLMGSGYWRSTLGEQVIEVAHG